MAINSFIYNNQSLDSFGMMPIPPNDTQQFVSRNIVRGEQTALRSKPNHFSTVYNDTLILNFFIVKSDICDSQDNYKLNRSEINSLMAWLESPKMPATLILISTDSPSVQYFGVFTSIQPFVYDDVCYGLYLTFTCNAPYGYSFEKGYSSLFSGTASSVSFSITNDSVELNEFICPVVTIESKSTFGDSESVSFKNITNNNNEMTLSLPKNRSKIVVDCEKKTIIDENGSLIPLSDVGVTIPQNSTYNFISTDMFVFYWLSFVAGTNNLVFTPSSTNTIGSFNIKWKEIIKSGGF